jgi:membrane-associated phospholipid phosphatase
MSAQKSLILSFTALLLIIVSYFYADQPTAQWCHTHLTQNEKEIFLFITQFGESTFYLIGFAILALLFHFYWKNALRANQSLFLFACVAVSGIAVDIVKIIAGRYRPSELFERGMYGFDFFHLDRALTSFPSGHTTTAFALAAAIGYLWPRYSVLAWLFALSVGISRIAITAHYPSDVMGGVLTGILSVSVLLLYWKKDPRES